MSDLKDQLIKLGAANPALQKHIRPLIASLSQAKVSAKAVDDMPWKFDAAGNPRLGQKLRVGRLGYVSYHQAKAHEDAGASTHNWGFTKNVAEYSLFTCRVCGATKKQKN